MSSKAWAIAAVIGAGVLLYACNANQSSSGGNDAAQPTCQEVYASTIAQVRSESVAGLDDEFQFLSDRCPNEYDILSGYMAGSATGSFRSDCADLVGRLPDESIEMLRADAHCDSTWVDATSPSTNAQPGGGISWDAALALAGSVQRVCGPHVSTVVDGYDVFINLGYDYPDTRRFTIVLWGAGEVESVWPGTTICAEGLIVNYDGVAQIHSPEVLQTVG